MSTPCLVLFTPRSERRILNEGGSGDWVLDVSRARHCRYAICVQNLMGGLREPPQESDERLVPHGTAFLIGEIANFVPVDGEAKPARWLVKFGRYARVDIDSDWGDRRNPVGYMSMEQLKIDPAALEFQAVPRHSERGSMLEVTRAAAATEGVRPLTLAEAKAGLSLYLGVDESAIEIVVRA